MFISIIAIQFLGILPLYADWQREDAEPYQIVFSNTYIDIDKNGKSVVTTDYEMKALNDEGRSQLVMQTVPFVPDETTVEVLSASSITDGVEEKVDVKNLKVRAAQGDKSGVTSLREVIIPFTNIKVGSVIKYSFRETKRKKLVNGLFNVTFVFGIPHPELGGKAKIRSKLPLYHSLNDPWMILKVTGHKDENYHYLEINQTKPIFKVPNEINPIFRKDKIAMIVVSTMDNWKDFVVPIASNYEKILSVKKLPPPLQKIALKAKNGVDLNDKIDIVTSELATIMTYSGDWSSFEKMYFPKKLNEIAKLKVGDCKDFAIATTAVLRSLGIKANVALTERKVPNKMGMAIVEPVDVKYPNQHLFNHAIVKVQDGKNIFWVDPTNTASNSSNVFSDIAGSFALDISKDSENLERIPHSEFKNNSLNFVKELSVNEDNSVDSLTTFDLNGDYAKSIVEYSLNKSPEMGQKILMAYLRTDSGSAKSFYEGVNFKSRIARSLNGKQKSLGEKLFGEKDGKKYLVAPLTFRLRGLTQVSANRVTDLNMESGFVENGVIRVLGYDFVGYKVGCTILTPWFDVKRKFLKIEKGFEVHDFVVLKKVEISSSDINSDKFQMALDDIGECAVTQAVEVRKMEPNEEMATRLKDYSIEKMVELSKVRGPSSINSSREALHIAEQILSVDRDSKQAMLSKVRALRMVGYKNNSVDDLEYDIESDLELNRLSNLLPNDPDVLIQKTYSAYNRKMNEEMLKAFAKAYVSSPKNFDLYYLGGKVSGRVGNHQAALKSFFKAHSLAVEKVDKGASLEAIAWTYLDINDLNNAIIYLKQAALENPDNTWTMGNLMSILSQNRKWDDAIEIGEKMVKVSTYGLAKKTLASAYAGKALEIMRNPKGSLNYDEVEGFLNKGLKVDSGCLECLLTLGQIKYSKAILDRDVESARKGLSYFERAEKTGKVQNSQIRSYISQLQNIVAGLPPFEPSKNRLPANSEEKKESPQVKKEASGPQSE